MSPEEKRKQHETRIAVHSLRMLRAVGLGRVAPWGEDDIEFVDALADALKEDAAAQRRRLRGERFETWATNGARGVAP